MPGLSHWQHPQFFGYFPCNGSLGSVLGDYVSTGLGVLGLAWQSSPALTELEEVVTDWLRQMVGLSRRLGRRDPGHRVDQHAGGAALRARAAHRLRARRAAACRPSRRPLVVYTSAHAPQLGGEGGAARRLRPRQRPARSPATPRYAMRADALAAAIADDAAAGRVPCAVVATTGTTTTTALDPVAAIARVAGRHRHLAARRRGDGRLGDGAARVPLDVGGRRGGRLAGAQPAQVARRGLRLLGLLRARRRSTSCA